MRKWHLILEDDRKNLISPKTEGGRTTRELWIPSEHLNIVYPSVALDIPGTEVKNTMGLGACWNWVLNADFTGDNVTRYDKIYDKDDGIMSIDIEKEPTKFNGLKGGWKANQYIRNASPELLNDLEAKANLVGKRAKNNATSDAALAYRRALTKAVISAAGFTVLPDDGDDRF